MILQTIETDYNENISAPKLSNYTSAKSEETLQQLPFLQP